MPNEFYEEDEIDLTELCMELLDHWKRIFFTSLVMAAIFFLVSFFLITPQFASTSELYVLSKSTSITSLTDIQVGSSLSTDYQAVITDRPVLDTVIQNLKLDMDYKELGEKISVDSPSERILAITVKDPDAKTAKKIADEMADVSAAFISQKMDQDPPSIISYGYMDNKKVSPHNIRNTIIGALLGFLLSAGMVILSFVMNNTIVNPEEMEKKLGLNLLGTVPIDENEKVADKHGMRETRKERKQLMEQRKRIQSKKGV